MTDPIRKLAEELVEMAREHDDGACVCDCCESGDFPPMYRYSLEDLVRFAREHNATVGEVLDDPSIPCYPQPATPPGVLDDEDVIVGPATGFVDRVVGGEQADRTSLDTGALARDAISQQSAPGPPPATPRCKHCGHAEEWHMGKCGFVSSPRAFPPLEVCDCPGYEEETP